MSIVEIDINKINYLVAQCKAIYFGQVFFYTINIDDCQSSILFYIIDYIENKSTVVNVKLQKPCIFL